MIQREFQGLGALVSDTFNYSDVPYRFVARKNERHIWADGGFQFPGSPEELLNLIKQGRQIVLNLDGGGSVEIVVKEATAAGDVKFAINGPIPHFE